MCRTRGKTDRGDIVRLENKCDIAAALRTERMQYALTDAIVDGQAGKQLGARVSSQDSRLRLAPGGERLLAPLRFQPARPKQLAIKIEPQVGISFDPTGTGARIVAENSRQVLFCF